MIPILLVYFLSGPERAQAVPSVRSGAVSTVTLLSVSRACDVGELKPVEWARDCLSFHFAIVRQPDATGFFTLSELKDFVVEGQKFSAVTKQELGRLPAANTVVEVADDYRAKVRPDLASLIPAGSTDNEVLMYTLISGAGLRTGAKGQVTIDVGWGKRTELFTFDFIVPAALRQ